MNTSTDTKRSVIIAVVLVVAAVIGLAWYFNHQATEKARGSAEYYCAQLGLDLYTAEFENCVEQNIDRFK